MNRRQFRNLFTATDGLADGTKAEIKRITGDITVCQTSEHISMYGNRRRFYEVCISDGRKYSFHSENTINRICEELWDFFADITPGRIAERIAENERQIRASVSFGDRARARDRERERGKI